MIGVIINASIADPNIKQKMFYRFGAQTILARLADSCLESIYAHRVIVSMPAADRGQIHGSLFGGQNYLIKPQITERGPHFDFNSNVGLGTAERLYASAAKHGLDTVVVVNAEDFLISGKLIDIAVERYMKNTHDKPALCIKPFNNSSMKAVVISWTQLCQMLNESSDFHEISPSIIEAGGLFGNPRFDITLSKLGNLAKLEHFFSEIDRGAALKDALSDLDGEIFE